MVAGSQNHFGITNLISALSIVSFFKGNGKMKEIQTSEAFVGKTQWKVEKTGIEKAVLSGGLCLLMEW